METPVKKVEWKEELGRTCEFFKVLGAAPHQQTIGLKQA